MPVAIDITGQIYGSWTVVRRLPDSAWLCRCTCGTESRVQGSTLKTGRSVRCRKCLYKKQEKGGTAARNWFLSYKCQAARRGYEWGLSFEEFEKLCTSNCHYCGSEPSQTYYSSCEVFVHGGIDRKDNATGYLPNNAVPCCPTCNYAKRDMSYDEFIAWVRLAAAHLQKTNFIPYKT